MEAVERLYDQGTFVQRLTKITHGMSGKKIAEIIGEKPGTVSKWKSEKYSTVPTTEQLMKLSKKFNCSVDYLLNISASPSQSLTGRQACDMLLVLDKHIGLNMELSEADTQSVLMRINYENTSGIGSNDSRNELRGVVVDFFRKYLELKKTPALPDGVLETCVEKWLSDIDKREATYTQISSDLAKQSAELMEKATDLMNEAENLMNKR